MKVDTTPNLDIHAFSGSGITEYEAGMTNVIAHEKNGTVKATQRPSIDISEDSSTIPALNDRGRGIYYWENNTRLYIVHDNDVYATTQGSTAVGTISTGTQRVQILETVGTPRLVILDAENDEGWVMDIAESVTAIASSFPATLAHGGAVLDGYLFVMDEDGIIYNSDIDDPTTFPPLGFLEAERDNDKGVYLGKHHDHIVSFNTRTIEFFYDAANATGSPLNRRQDISYTIGCASGLGVWENGDITYFLGSNPEGQLSIYNLENFKVTPVVTDTMSSYLTQGVTQSSLDLVMNGVSAMGHDTLLITIYTLTGAAPGQIVPQVTISFDAKTGLWGFWSTATNSTGTFPLMAWTKRTGGQNATVAARTGEGILYNGDIISINDNLIPIDTLLGNEGVYEVGVYETDVYTAQGADTGLNIPITIRTGLQDGGILGYKFQARESVVAENTHTSQTLTIKHSDQHSDNFNAGSTIDMVDERKEVHQGGRFTKRNYQLEFAGDEQIFIEHIDVLVEAGL